ncbi:UNVERIFIED_CONTAM: hypothetical protein NCL1_44088 [Trichonephila clavipes]
MHGFGKFFSTSPSNILRQQPLHSNYVTSWYEFTAEFVLRPFSLKLLHHKVLKDALSRVHGTVNFFNNRSFQLYRNANVCKPLSLCKMEQHLPLGVKSKNFLVLTLAIIVPHGPYSIYSKFPQNSKSSNSESL